MLRCLAAVAIATVAGSAALLPVGVASASPAANSDHAELVGVLGYEGGAAPGGFHPTSGSVRVEFDSEPLTLRQSVGKSGHFEIGLAPGGYTVIGCGPTASSSPSAQCSKPKNITLTAGEVRHIKLVWALAP
jgi:hypothetical protein